MTVLLVCLLVTTLDICQNVLSLYITASLAKWFRRPTGERADPGFDSCLRHLSFYESSHTGDLQIVPTLPDAWLFRISAGTG